ncbi:MAG TPA: hypothetical protein VFT53_01195 [Candidatus Saccharimonadales bacterium]|nr:hypothetical protein [Candidatus Saccharimonadales bacterium]
MKIPKPVATTAKQSLITKCWYVAADRDGIWRDYRSRLPNSAAEGNFRPFGAAYGALQ